VKWTKVACYKQNGIAHTTLYQSEQQSDSEKWFIWSGCWTHASVC